MEQAFCTEKEVRDILLAIAKETDETPSVFVAYRVQEPRKLHRTVTFVLQTREGNEELVNLLVKGSSENDMMFRFVKSDINIQNGNLTVDFIFVDADIYPNLT